MPIAPRNILGSLWCVHHTRACPWCALSNVGGNERCTNTAQLRSSLGEVYYLASANANNLACSNFLRLTAELPSPFGTAGTLPDRKANLNCGFLKHGNKTVLHSFPRTLASNHKSFVAKTSQLVAKLFQQAWLLPVSTHTKLNCRVTRRQIHLGTPYTNKLLYFR